MDEENARYWLNKIKQQYGYSDVALAAMLRVDVTTLARWRRGKQRIEHARILGLALRRIDDCLSRNIVPEEDLTRISGTSR